MFEKIETFLLKNVGLINVFATQQFLQFRWLLFPFLSVLLLAMS